MNDYCDPREEGTESTGTSLGMAGQDPGLMEVLQLYSNTNYD